MRSFNPKKNLPSVLLLLLLCGLILCPLITVFEKAVIIDGRLDLYQAWRTIANAENVQTVCNSLWLGVCVVLCSTVIAVPTAYLLARTRLAAHGWLDIVFMIPFMTPPYIASMGWILFMQKRGLFQQLFPATGSWSEGFFCFGGLVLVMSLHVFPFLMTMLKNAMLNIPASLEESGAVFGAGFGLRLRRIFAPLLTGNYAIGALLVFVKTLSEYGTPYTLGRRIGFYVFTTDIHRYSTTAPIDFGRSASLSSVLICICMAMWLMQNYITGKNSYRLVSGKGSRPARTKLSVAGQIGAWLWVALVILVAVGVPYFSIIATSLIKLRGYGLAAGRTFGGTPAYVFCRVTLPMISRGIFAGWMMIFIIAFRELVTASLIAPPNTLVVSTYINREFEQGSVSLGMAMAVLCVLITTTALLVFNRFVGKRKGA